MDQIIGWLLKLPLFSWWQTRSSERRERDRGVFLKLDADLGNARLVDVLATLSLPSFPRDLLSELDSYIRQAHRVEYEFLDSQVQEKHQKFVRTMIHLDRFLDSRIEPHHSPAVERYQFLPRKNIDIAGRPEDMEEFDRQYQELLERLESVRQAYDEYRRSIATRLRI